ncbi:AMP-binding protein [Streptomyces murinus]|uniref:AMP-binding protein n=1 Tax=Streptomyces murinus TaxID=33900 RepID=UPI003D66B5F3
MEAQLDARLASTFVDVVQRQAGVHGDREAFSYIRDMSDGQITDSLSYRELDAQARVVAGWLTKQGGSSGDRVLLCFPPGLDFIVGFFGCLYAGMVAVPAPCPRGSARPRTGSARSSGTPGSISRSPTRTAPPNSNAGSPTGSGPRCPAVRSAPWTPRSPRA